LKLALGARVPEQSWMRSALKKSGPVEVACASGIVANVTAREVVELRAARDLVAFGPLVPSNWLWRGVGTVADFKVPCIRAVRYR
jgi:hypothetical protein